MVPLVHSKIREESGISAGKVSLTMVPGSHHPGTVNRNLQDERGWQVCRYVCHIGLACCRGYVSLF